MVGSPKKLCPVSASHSIKGVCASLGGDAAICSIWLIRRGGWGGLSLGWFNDCGCSGFFSKESLRMSNNYHEWHNGVLVVNLQHGVGLSYLYSCYEAFERCHTSVTPDPVCPIPYLLGSSFSSLINCLDRSKELLRKQRCRTGVCRGVSYES